jgi:uncharacterized membrane protein YdjX (TVP38/TMEM64 family)
MEPPMTDTPAAPRSGVPRLVILLGIVLALGVLSFLGLDRYVWENVRGRLAETRTWVEANLLLAAVVYFSVYVLSAGLSLPIATVLSLAAGALFGVWVGTGLACSAATIGATLAMLTSRHLFRDAVQRRWSARLEPLQRGIERDGAFYLFTLRLVPLFPFFLINLGMGLTRIRPLVFAAVSFVGMLPACVVYVNAGTKFEEVRYLRDILSFEILGSLALLGIVPLVLRKTVQWITRNRARDHSTRS